MPYRNSLRVLGRLLDGDKARMVTVCEIEQGFLLHYFQGGEPHRVVSSAIHAAEVMDLDDLLQKQRGASTTFGPSKGFSGLLGLQQRGARRFQQSHPLCPMGYEEALRSLGNALDRRSAQSIVLSELEKHIHVEYVVDRADFVVQNGQRIAQAGRRQESYTAKQLAELVQSRRDGAMERVRRSGSQLAYNPLDVTSYLEAAPVLEDHGQHVEAEDLYRQALDASPQHPEVHYHLARHARRRGDRKAALKHLEAAIQRNSADGRFFHLQGRLFVEQKRLQNAAQAFQQAVLCEPANRVYLFRLGQVYQLLGRGEDAQAILAGGLKDGDARSSQPLDVAGPRQKPRKAAERAPASAAEPVAQPATSGLPGGLDDYPSPAGQPYPTYEPEQLAESSPFSLGHVAARSNARANFPLPAAPGAAAGLGDSADSPASLWDKPELPSLPPYAEAPEPDGDAASRQPAADGRVHDTALAEAAATADWMTTSLPAEDWTTSQAPEEWPVTSPPTQAEAAQPATTEDWTAQSLPTVRVEVPSTAAAPAPARDDDDTPAGTHYDGLVATAEPIQPDSPDDLVRLAAAIMRAEEMVRAEPHRADLHRKLGFLLAKQGRSEEAAAAFRRAVACARRRVAS